ncbi:hypothetical protein Tco_1259128 [Tanacetum coccineum]
MTLAPSTSIDKLLKDFDELMSTPIDFSSYNIRVISFTMKMEILLESTSNKLMVNPYGFEGIFKDGNGDYSTLPKMENSSMNTSILSSISSWKMIVIQCWKVAGALNNPNGICLYAKVPYGQNFKKPGFLDSSSSLGGSTLEDFNRISEAFHSSGSTGSVLDFLMLKVTVSFPTLRKLEELRRKYSRKVLRGVNGSVLVSLEEDASSSKRFLPSMARDSF